jgi:hypothetical protein
MPASLQWGEEALGAHLSFASSPVAHMRALPNAPALNVALLAVTVLLLIYFVLFHGCGLSISFAGSSVLCSPARKGSPPFPLRERNYEQAKKYNFFLEGS